MSERLVKTRLLPQMRESVERYTGRWVPANAHDWDIVLNELYPIIQYELPAIFFRNPRVYLKPRNKNFIAKRLNPITGEKEDVFLDSTKSAHTQEAILNYTLQEIRFKEEVRRVLLDALLFKHGVLWHGYKGNFGMTEEQSLYIKDGNVFVKRISPMMFLWDPCVTISNLDEARWVARAFDIPLKDLQEDDTLDVDKNLKGLVGYGFSDEEKTPVGGADYLSLAGQAQKTILDYTDREFKESPLARFVRVYEVFIRSSKKEIRNGEKGKILLYTKEQFKPLRVNPWPYKAEGWPVQILQFNDVPDSIFGLADVEVFGPITDQKNTVINLQLRNAQENSKSITAIAKEGTSEEDIEKVLSGEQTVITYDGTDVTGRVIIASRGGAESSQLYMLDGRIQMNLDEKSGVADIRKGIVKSGEESATSVQIRNAGSSARPAYRQDLMADFLRRSVHFLNQLIKQYFTVDEAVRIVGSLDLEWSDTPSKEEIQAETDAEIDIQSMLPETPEKEIQEKNTILSLMFNAIQNPGIYQKLQQEGKTFNLSPIIENLLFRLKVRDSEVFRNIRPEESQGFVSVSEVRAAGANIKAAMAGQPPPVPPQQGQDHRAHLEMYSDILGLIQEMGNTITSQLLQQLIAAHQALAEEEAKNKAPQRGQSVSLKNPSAMEVG